MLRFALILTLLAGAPCGNDVDLHAAASTQETATTPQARGFDHTHAAWSGLLGKHVREGLLDYRSLAKEREALDAYLEQLAAVTPEQLKSWDKPEQFAFYANAYNAHVAVLMLDAYPLTSINDLSTEKERVWDRRFIPLGPHLEAGRDKISLDELENAILRPRYGDARVHVAVNCASIGCPPLDSRAIAAKGLDEQLDRLMRGFLADTQRNRFDARTKQIELSQIFSWFEQDFADAEGSLKGYLKRYAPADAKGWIDDATISYRDYDWSLNDAPRR